MTDIEKLADAYAKNCENFHSEGLFAERFDAFVVGYKAAQSKQGSWTDEDLENCWDYSNEAACGSDGFPMGGNTFKYQTFAEYLQNLKDFKTQQAIYKNYPNLNASKEEMDEMRKLK